MVVPVSGPAKPRTGAIPSIGRGAVGQSQIFDRSGRIAEYWSSDDKCPQCKTDRYLSPRLRLMVSPCYHKMCESCIDRLFSLGPAACPECGQIVRKQQFSAQTFQDLRVEEEVDVRKRVSKLFNRKPNEFPSLKAYNDYLEEFEEITFNLVNKVDVEHTQARLAQYEALNKAQIAAHLQFREQESQRQHQADEAAKQERQMRTKRVMEEQEREQAARDADEKEMMAMLTNGTSIEEVVKERQRRIDKRAKEAALREEKEQTRMQQYEEALQKRVAPRTTYTPLETEYIRKVLASDFCGPFATLRDGSDLCTVRNTPAKLGGLGGDGYVDPWLRPELVDASAVSQYRAGGYEWDTQVWQRGLNTLCDSVVLRPAS